MNNQPLLFTILVLFQTHFGPKGLSSVASFLQIIFLKSFYISKWMSAGCDCVSIHFVHPVPVRR
jgi:hypothetical protein